MTDGEIVDYDAEYIEAEERYIKEHYSELRCPDKDKRTVHRGDTLDEYLKLLIDGYINVELRTGLEKYLMELLEDEWFYQWPFVHWAYASRLLYKAKSDRAKKKAVERLRPLAEAKCPGALYDMGYCYMHGVGLEYSYNKAIHYWVMASQLGYLDSQTALLEEYRYGSDYKNLPEELRLQFHYEVTRLVLRENHADEHSIHTKLNAKDSEKFRKFCKATKVLEEQVAKQQRLQEIGVFFWGDDENPYKTIL